MQPKIELKTEIINALLPLESAHPWIPEAIERLLQLENSIQDEEYFEIFWLILRTALQIPSIIRDKRSQKLRELGRYCAEHIKITHPQKKFSHNK